MPRCNTHEHAACFNHCGQDHRNKNRTITITDYITDRSSPNLMKKVISVILPPSVTLWQYF